MIRLVFVFLIFNAFNFTQASEKCLHFGEDISLYKPGFNAIKLFNDYVFLPNTYIPSYSLKNGEFLGITYYSYLSNENGEPLDKQEHFNSAFIGSYSNLKRSFEEVVSLDIEAVFSVECRELEIRVIFDPSIKSEVLFIGNDEVAMIYTSDILGSWKSVLSHYVNLSDK